MASYTDAIAQFNPYVQQLPVELMAKVGMAKQAQYDQGVQKVQSYIDNVAGIDILHSADKEYLQSKLGELGNKLKTVAAGDFSNQQLVNSVGGMTSQIVKDENIQNAMFSAANAKKQQARIDEDLKKGKLNKSSEYIYNKSLDQYLSTPKTGQKFTGQYKPRTSEWDKKILETIKTLQPNLTQEDIAYSINPKTGLPDINLVAEVMQRHTDKRVDEGKIRTAINAVLNSDDLEQMREDGIYNYRNYTEKDLANLVTEKADQNFELGAKRLRQLRTRLPGLTDPDQILETKQQIAEYEKLIGDPYEDKPSALRINQQETISSLSDPDKLDQLKAKVFLQNTIDEYANAFAYAEIKNELMTNPVQLQENWRAEQDFRRQVEANNQYDKAVTRSIEKEKLILLKEKNERDKGEYEQKMAPPGGTPTYTGVGSETEQERKSVINWLDDTQKYRNQNALLRNQLKDKMGGMFSDLTDAEVDAKIDAYRKNPAKNKPDDNSIKEIMDSYLANQRYIAKKELVLKQAGDKATQEVTGGKGIYGMMRDDLSKLPPLTINSAKGKLTFTAEEVMAYEKKYEKAKSTQTGPGAAAGAAPLISVTASGSMTPKEYLLYDYFKKSGRYRPGLAGKSNDPAVNAYMTNTLQSVRFKYTNIDNQIAERKVELLAPYAGTFKPEAAGITFSGKEGDNKQNFIDKLRVLVSNDVRQEGGGKNYDAKGLLKTLSEKGADALLGFGVERAGNQYFIQVQDDSGDFQNVPVTPEFIRKNLGAGWLNRAADTQMQLYSFGGNSNPTNNVELSQYAPNDFGNFDNGSKSVTLDIYANLKDQGNGNAAVTFNLKNKRGEVIPIVWPGRQGITSIENFPQWLKVQSDATLLPLLRGLYPQVDNFLKR
jgi:hypothetical protein